MKSITFTSEHQLAFAQLSGDYNPLHLDALAARRLMYGAPVVHGIHSLLWGLEAWLEQQTGPVELRSLKISFPKALPVGVAAQVSISPLTNTQLRIEVTSEQSLVTSIDCEWAKSDGNFAGAVDAGFPEKQTSYALSLDEIAHKSGQLPLHFNLVAGAQMFPHLTKCVSPVTIAAMLAATRLVAVDCPGLHSVFSEFTLTAADPPGAARAGCTLGYQVTKLEKRFGLVLMSITAPGLTGTIKAFVRPPPHEQPGFAKLKPLVRPGEFAGQRAFVVGGSRGLGEVTAKLLAAGGTEVKITYHQGLAEADRVVQDIISGGGAASALQLNVLDAQQSALAEALAGWNPTHLYYFATPFIFAGSKGLFSTSLFQKFCDYYVTGFLNVLNPLRSVGLRKVFHPSSVAVEELPADMAEYAAAKMAAETLCQTLAKNRKAGLVIYKPRLPRMGTDQTATFLPVNNADPVPVMLEHLRAFHVM
ncbi:MAG TPA: MaoC/PaaZ C-terminal domain-containing protein [Pirellulales bacterium]|jgi:acyl dehydratase|nr:MaoC/PaaZ C-terminal domain-containing protein [Pirellulales bacterium]